MPPSKRDEYLGKVYVNNQGLKMTVIDYKSYVKVTVEFEDGAVREVQMGNILLGNVKHPSNSTQGIRDERLGKIYTNSQGLRMKVIDYKNNKCVTVEFEDGITRESDMSTIKKGQVRHPHEIGKHKNNSEQYLGRVYTNNKGLKMKIVEYRNSKNVTVEFEDGARVVRYLTEIKRGNVSHPIDKTATADENREKYTGVIIINKQNLSMQIVEYNNARDVMVKFEDGCKVRASLNAILNGLVRNPNKLSVCGVGCIGSGAYRSKIDGVIQEGYSVWKSMMNRCYNEKVQNDHISYRGCTVSKEWCNYQNFASWWEIEKYNIGEDLDLDKDILVKGNKEYSSKNCIIVPSNINRIVVRHQEARGKYPIGVIGTVNNKYSSSLSYLGKVRHLGTHDTPEQAFQAYKQAKENYMQQVANEYKQKYGDKFPDKVYEAIMNYRVHIND